MAAVAAVCTILAIDNFRSFSRVIKEFAEMVSVRRHVVPQFPATGFAVLVDPCRMFV
jgi:hypothetical protein